VIHSASVLPPGLPHLHSCISQFPIRSSPHQSVNLREHLLLDNVLELVGSSRERRDAVTELFNSHLVLVEVEAVLGLVVEVLELGEVEALCVLCVELLRNLVLGVVELLEEGGLYLYESVIERDTGKLSRLKHTAMVR